MDVKPSGADEPANGVRKQPPPSADAEAGETFGVVEFTRRVKDDGRALIVFTRPPPR